MNWTKWSAISEITSSLAILVTLVYLTVQVQQNTVAMNADTRTTLWELHTGVLDHVIEQPSIVIMYTKQESLTEEEKIVLGNWLFEFFGQREFMWLQSQSQVLDQATMETMISDITQLLVYPRILQWWELTREFYFDPGFVELVSATATNEAIDSYKPWMPEWR